MGAFALFNTSDARTFKINTTTNKINRPNRFIHEPDLLGAVIDIDGVKTIITGAGETETGLVAYVSTSAGVKVLTYTTATDVFTYDGTTMTNVMMDQYDREISNS